MEISIITQLMVSVLSAVLGLFLGVLYDIIRIWRTFLGITYINKFTERLKSIKLPFIKNPILKEKKQRRITEGIILFVTDIIYFLITTLIMIVFVYYVNNGVVRWYIFVGAMTGLLGYYFTIGKLVISISEYITFFIRVIISYVGYFISRPFVPVLRWTKNILSRFKEALKKRSALKKEKEYSKRQELYRSRRLEL